MTFIAGLRCDRLIAPWIIDGPMNADIFEQLNRPGFTGGCFVQMSGYFIKHIQVCIECLLSFARRCVTNGAV